MCKYENVNVNNNVDEFIDGERYIFKKEKQKYLIIIAKNIINKS